MEEQQRADESIRKTTVSDDAKEEDDWGKENDPVDADAGVFRDDGDDDDDRNVEKNDKEYQQQQQREEKEQQQQEPQEHQPLQNELAILFGDTTTTTTTKDDIFLNPAIVLANQLMDRIEVALRDGVQQLPLLESNYYHQSSSNNKQTSSSKSEQLLQALKRVYAFNVDAFEFYARHFIFSIDYYNTQTTKTATEKKTSITKKKREQILQAYLTGKANDLNWLASSSSANKPDPDDNSSSDTDDCDNGKQPQNSTNQCLLERARLLLNSGSRLPLPSPPSKASSKNNNQSPGSSNTTTEPAKTQKLSIQDIREETIALQTKLEEMRRRKQALLAQRATTQLTQRVAQDVAVIVQAELQAGTGDDDNAALSHSVAACITSAQHLQQLQKHGKEVLFQLQEDKRRNQRHRRRQCDHDEHDTDHENDEDDDDCAVEESVVFPFSQESQFSHNKRPKVSSVQNNDDTSLPDQYDKDRENLNVNLQSLQSTQQWLMK